MSSDIAISVKNLTKTYRLFDHPGDRIKQALTFGRVKFHKEFTALKDVSFEVRKGETVGIIGKNGSGKSTLLQLICGILKPTSGSVTVNGRISALLELGSGFNPEFTGLENIYFQGAIMGFNKEEVDARVEDIIAFADIGEFIDQPVRTYSSGMFVRLAFATAIHSEPGILVIDEALAVGDLGFQKKSFSLMSQMITDEKVTVIIVSHDLRQIQRFCKTVLFLENGYCIDQGNSHAVCSQYYQSMISDEYDESGQTARIIGSDEAKVLSVELMNASGTRMDAFKSGDSIRIRIEFQLNVFMQNPEIIIGTQASDLTYLSSSSTMEFGVINALAPGWHFVECVAERFPLKGGLYFVRFVIRDNNFRLVLSGETLKSFKVLPANADVIKPPSLLDLQASWTVDGKPIIQAENS